MNLQRRFYLGGIFASFISGLGVPRIGNANTKLATLLVELDINSRTRDAGYAIEAGVRAAFNANPTELRPVIINTHGNPIRGRDALEENWKKSSPIAVIGGGDSNVAATLSHWAQPRQIPYAILWASDGGEDATTPWTFRFGLSDQRCLTSLFEKPYSKKRWGFLLSNDISGRSTYETILESFASNTMIEFIGVQWQDADGKDIIGQYMRLKEQGAQAIWLSGHPRVTVGLAQGMYSQIQARERIPVLLSSNAWSSFFTSKVKAEFVGLPLYFALPNFPSEIDLPTHPIRTQAYRLTEDLIRLFNQNSAIGAIELRSQIARSWRALEKEVSTKKFGFYSYVGRTQLRQFSIAEVLG